jgi:hypothetical protein
MWECFSLGPHDPVLSRAFPGPISGLAPFLTLPLVGACDLPGKFEKNFQNLCMLSTNYLLSLENMNGLFWFLQSCALLEYKSANSRVQLWGHLAIIQKESLNCS